MDVNQNILILVLCSVLSTSTLVATNSDDASEFDIDLGDIDYSLYFDDETEEGEESWRRFDDEIEAKEEEYARSRRQILINRMQGEREQERSKSKVTNPCPLKCTCPARNEVHCTFRFLPKIPEDLPADLEKLNLGYNKLSTLPSHVFDKYSATLRFLYLHSNDIRSLSNGVFSKQHKVEVLRLSWNKITGVRKIALHGLHSVERLYLDNNRLSFIHPLALRGLLNLKLLQLEGNRLSRLHHDVFVTIEFEKYFKFSSIQYLYISKNHLENLPRQIFDNMQELNNAYIHGNRWDCSCDLKWLKRWIDEEDKYRCKHNTWKPRQPVECATCSWPPSLEGIRLQDVTLDNFTCESPSFDDDMVGSIHYDVHNGITDPDVVARYNDIELFRYSNFYSTRMNIRLDSLERSIFHASCELTRVPDVNMREIFDEKMDEDSMNAPQQSSILSSRSYAASFESLMECVIEYPQNVTTMRNILEPYLGREMNFTLRRMRPDKSGKLQTVYSISVSPDEDYHITTPITGGSISSDSGFMRSPSSLVILQSRHFLPEEQTLYVVFQTSFTHTYLPEAGKYAKTPWVLIKQPPGTVTSVVIALERKTIAIRCKAVGQPKPDVTWVLPGELVLRSGESDGRFSVSKSGRLFIRRPIPEDSDIYRCIATVPEVSRNAQPEFRSSSDAEVSAVRVVVFERNKDTLITDKHLSELRMHTVEEGDEWTSDCVVQSLPNATVGWATPNYQLLVGKDKDRQNKVTTTRTGGITVNNFDASDQGVYRCLAANSVGRAEYVVYVGMTNRDNKLIETVEVPDYEVTPDDLPTTDNDLVVLPPPIVSLITGHQRNKEEKTYTVLNRTEVIVVVTSDQKTTPEEDEITEEETLAKNTTKPVQKRPRPEKDITIATTTNTTTANVSMGHQETIEIDALDLNDLDSSDPEPLHPPGTVIAPVVPDIMSVSATTTAKTKTTEKTTEHLPVDVPEEERAAPVILEFRENPMNAIVGATVTIPCNAVGSPTPDLEWFRRGDSSPIPREPRAPTSDSPDVPSVVFVTGYRKGNLALVIYGVTKSDGGFYTCRAVNEAGITRRDINLVISDPVRPQDEDKELEISTFAIPCGEAASIPCSLIPRFPASMIHWIVPDGSSIPASSTRKNGISVYGNGTLVIKSASSQHGGTYKCQIRSPLNAGYMIAEVTVECTPPRIIAPSVQDVEVDYGEQVKVECEASGFPRPKVIWRLLGSRDIVNSETLKIGKATVNATYLCVATNSNGEDSHDLRIKVKSAKPTFSSDLAASVSALNGLSARLDCSAEGIPLPSYTWYFPNGTEISSSPSDSNFQQSYAVLLIRAVNPSLTGKYKCSARNALGVNNITVNLVVTQPPVLVTTTKEIGPPAVGGEGEIDIDRNEPKSPTTSTGDQIKSPTTYDSTFTKTPKWLPKKPIRVAKVTRVLNSAAFKADPTVPDILTQPVTTPERTLANLVREITTSNSVSNRTTFSTVTSQKSRKHHSAVINDDDITSGHRRISSYELNRVRLIRKRPADSILAEQSIRRGHSRRHNDGMSRMVRQRPAYRRRRIYDITMAAVGLHGDRIALHCKTITPSTRTSRARHHGHGVPRITWTFPNGAMYDARYTRTIPGWKYSMYGNGTLVIADLVMKDAGQYKCEVLKDDEDLQIRTLISLRVKTVRPQIMERLKEYVNLKPGDSILLPCTAEGHPQPLVRWTIPTGESLKTGSWRDSMTVFDNGTLLISGVRSDQGGSYACSAENIVGKMKRTVDLLVTSLPPRFLHPRSRIRYVREGDSLRLPCSASGSPAPSLSWTMPNSRIINVNEAIFQGKTTSPKIAVVSSGTLIINRATHKDVGRYYCTAENPLGRDSSLVIVRVYT